ncbi:hypothetical protein QCA50_014437 [Cerrena zonata]|uniref:Uncharacterized protein n=1 Tax=Cerrena zonata TaxID=2478898 RepID=A0AAW0FTK8_9APHY
MVLTPSCISFDLLYTIGLLFFNSTSGWYPNSVFTHSTPKVKAHEDTAFAHLSGLFNAIVKATAPVLGFRLEDAKWKVQTHPTFTVKSENNLHATYKPDGFTVLLEPCQLSGGGSHFQHSTQSLKKPLIPIRLLKFYLKAAWTSCNCAEYVRRDINLGNVFRCNDGYCKISDFE